MAPQKSSQAYNPSQFSAEAVDYPLVPVLGLPYEENDQYYTLTSQPSRLDAVGPSTECFIPIFLKKKIMGTPGYPSVPPNPSIPGHRIMPSSLGGLGMFATRKLTQGQVILSERALVVVPLLMPRLDQPKEDLSPEDDAAMYWHFAEKHMQNLLQRMSDENRKAYLSLCDGDRKDGSGPLASIMRTNAYAIDPLRKEGEEGVEGGYSGVFNQLSRINHSCGPNATRRFDMPSFSMRLYATRDIAQGEEITLKYDWVWERTVSRQKKLDFYGFRCKCSCCANAAESDRRRARIEARYNQESIQKRIAAIKLMPKGKGTNEILMKDIDEGLRLFKEEGLEGHEYYSTFLWYVCAVLSAIGTDGARFSKCCYALLRCYLVEGSDLGEMKYMFHKGVVPLYRLHYPS